MGRPPPNTPEKRRKCWLYAMDSNHGLYGDVNPVSNRICNKVDIANSALQFVITSMPLGMVGQIQIGAPCPMYRGERRLVHIRR
jgi:hypothetical protein